MPFTVAFLDIGSALKRLNLVFVLAWRDIVQRYRRSTLGPFWITLSMGVMIGTLGLVFGKIFKTPLQEFLPFVSLGIIFWTFISTTITEGANSFISAENIIKQLPLPLFTHVLRILWRNVLILGHNLVIFPLVLLMFFKSVSIVALLSVLGFLLLFLNLGWLTLFLAIFCTRYRDLSSVIGNLIQVMFYITPIMWMPHFVSGHAGFYLLSLNPAYHLLQIVRAPLLGEAPSLANWMVSMGIALVGWMITLVLYNHYRNRIAYWL